MVSVRTNLQVLVNFGVSRVIASGHLDFKVGDLVWGMTGWEEYTLVPKPESFFKISPRVASVLLHRCSW